MTNESLRGEGGQPQGGTIREPLSRTVYLLSIRGLRWKEVLLAAFNVYIDDSGTDPKQKVAIAVLHCHSSRKDFSSRQRMDSLKRRGAIL